MTDRKTRHRPKKTKLAGLKIGFVLDDSLDKTDGVQQYVLTLGHWLAAQGHDVHFLVGETRRTDVKAHSLSKNINVRFNGNRMSIPLPANRDHLRSLLDQERFDVLHVQMPYSPQMTGRLLQLVPDETAVVGTFHIVAYGALQKAGTKALSWLLKRNGHRFDTYLSVSPAAQQFAKQWYGIDSQLLPNVINSKKYKSKTVRHQGLKVVFLGRLVERKGCAQLLQAISLMPGSVRDQLSVIIGGQGPLQRRLVRQAERLNIHDRVFFVGFVEEADKAAFLAQADVAVFPSLGGESFGIVLLEAMAAGAGVVMAADNVGYGSVLGAIPQCLFNPRQPRHFAERLELLLRDVTLRQELHTAQQAVVKNYDVNRVGRELITIYEAAIAKRQAKRHNG